MGQVIKGTQLALVLSLMFLSAISNGADGAIEVGNKSYWICKNKKEVRTIRVQIDAETNLCATLYSKLGSEKVVGSGKMHDSCMSFLSNIKDNLEKSNWSCRDISSTKITSTTE